MRRLTLPVTFALAALGAALFFPVSVYAYNGKLRVECNVPGKVYLNDVHVGKTGEIISGLPFGYCKLAVYADNYRKHEQVIQIVGNDIVEIEVALLPGEGESPPPDREEPDGEEPDGEKPDGEEPDGEEPDGEEPEENDPEEEDPDKDKPDIDIADMDDVEKASKAKDNGLLREILKNSSDYPVRVAAAGALFRLRSKAGIDFVDGEIKSGFAGAPLAWFNESPFFGQNRVLANYDIIADVLEERKFKLDSFEKVVAGYAATLKWKEIQNGCNTRIKGLKSKMARLKRKKPAGWWEEHSRYESDLKRSIRSMKDLTEVVSGLLSIMKKASRFRGNKDMAALAKYFCKHASGKK